MHSLIEKRRKLEKKLNRGHFDFAEWSELADEFEADGQFHGMLALLKKARHYEKEWSK